MKNYFLTTILFLFTLHVNAIQITDLSQIKGHESEVTEIDLSNTGLIEFPKEILTCKNLVRLNLSNNGLINIPIALSKFEHLVELNLSDNQGLSYPDLDSIFLDAKFQLEILNLSECEMGYMPRAIGNQKNITKLYLSANRLKALPYTIIQLSKLEKLDISDNNIEDISWQVHQWWNLKELNVAGNKELKTTELLFSLSYYDKLEKLTISNLKEIPNDFQHLNVNELVIHDSNLNQFPRRETSSQIKRLSLINCEFKNPSKFAEVINKYVAPEFLCLRSIKRTDLLPFLSLSVDSIDIQNNQLTDIYALAAIKELEWVDARGNNITKQSIENLAKTRPDLKLLVQEPVKQNIGIAPPIPKFVKAPTIKKIKANKPVNVQIGKTNFNFPEGVFMDASGNEYKGEVQLSYTEYFTPTEVLLSGITMTADSVDETMMFSSAGMFNIEAQDSQGNELAVNPEKEIGVNMLSSNADTDMNLYYLNEDGVWENKGKDEIVQPFKVDMAKVDSVVNAKFTNFKETNLIVSQNRFIPRIKNNGKLRSFEIKFDELFTNRKRKEYSFINGMILMKEKKALSSFVANTSLVYDGDSVVYYKKQLKSIRKRSQKAYRRLRLENSRNNNDYAWGINFITNMDLVVDDKQDRLRLNFMFKDSAVSIPVVLKSHANNPSGRIKTFEKYFKKFSQYRIKDAQDNRRNKRKVERIMRQQEQAIKNLARTMEINRQQIYFDNRYLMDSQANRGSIVRSFGLRSFGVFNCDVLSRMVAPIGIVGGFVLATGALIKKKLKRIMVVDYKANGVLSFSKKDDVFYDSKSKSAVVIFFTDGVVGIYKNWKDKKRNNDINTPLELINLDNISNSEFQNILER